MERVETTVNLPMKVLAIYGGKDNEYYIESHAVKNGKVLEGRPLQRKALREMAKVILKKDETFNVGFKGTIPKELLNFKVSNGMMKLLWIVPASIRQMFFTKDLQIPNGKSWQPNLIFLASGRDLYVHAYKDNGKPVGPKTKLFIPPYHNISREGLVCQGSAKLQKVNLVDEMMKQWEAMFFNSYFSHAGGLHEALTFNINQFWKNQISTQCKFPDTALTPTKLTVGDILESKFNSELYIDDDDDQ